MRAFEIFPRDCMYQQNLSSAFHYLVVTMILLLLHPASVAAPASLDDTPIRQARLYEKQGNYQQASDMYLLTAAKLPRADGEKWRVKAAEMAWFAGNSDQASRILATLDESSLDHVTLIHARLIAARIARSHADYATVLQKLDFPSSSAPTKLQRTIATLLEEAREKTGLKPQTQASPRIPRRDSTDTRFTRDFDRTWNELMTHSSQDLSRRLAQPLSPIEKGWTELAYIAKTTADSPEALDNQLAQWELTYRNHPAYPDYFNALRGPGTIDNAATLPTQINRVAVLIPTSGPLASLANVILEGIMAAKYQLPGTNIKVYDTAAGTPIQELYDQAVIEGAELIIGPMDKARVDALTRLPLTVPVISLNYGKNPEFANPNLFQFALLPEDEARQAARQMLADGHTRLAILVPAGEWGERILQAFREETQANGGEVVATGRFKPGSNEYSNMIKRALKPNSKTHLNGVDAEAIFFAASPKQARLLMPLIKFHFINSLPVYATSHVYDGFPDPSANRDLNRLSFTEIPWLLNEAAPGAPKPEELDETTRHHPRLFAFGYDALSAAPRLRQESMTANQVRALSGILTLDGRNRIHRQLGWARFSRGRAKTLHPAGSGQPQFAAPLSQ